MPKFMNLITFLKMDEHNENNNGGNGGKDQNKDQSKDQNKQTGGTVTLTQEQFDKIMAKLNGTDQSKKESDNEDLASKAAAAAKAKEKAGSDSKALESAIVFNTSSKEWLKTNASLLPKDVQGIFDAAEKETYDSQIDKASAIKSGLIQTFFKVQENLDLLTAAQKNSLEDWLKLTKNGKEEKAQQMFDIVFEPTFEMLKRIKKAQQVAKGGAREGSDSENIYKEKLMNSAKKHYMGAKQNA